MIGPRKVDKDLILYGAGKLGKLALQMFGELKIPVRMILDKNSHTGVMHPDHVSQAEKEDCLLAVCVASEPYQPIHDSLKAAGWTDIVPVWDVIEAYPEIGIRNGWFITAVDEEEWVPWPWWADKISNQHYWAMCFWRRFREELPLTIEPKDSLPSTLADIRLRQRVILFADTPLIRAVGIHCEGCELQTVEANLPLFKKYRPKIEVACYHSKDGLWKIPKFLMDNLERYRFYFRLHAYMGQGAYIIGKPNEENT